MATTLAAGSPGWTASMIVIDSQTLDAILVDLGLWLVADEADTILLFQHGIVGLGCETQALEGVLLPCPYGV
jgi:hypothetical protein